MSDINAEIQYNWKFGWDPNGMSEPRPKVNRLLKAILEGDVRQMELLFAQGASLTKINKNTLEAALYHILGNYDVVSCMIKHGFIGLNGDFEYFDCLEPAGYTWGLLARAWYKKAYDVMDLLARAGFRNMNYCIAGKEKYDGIELSFYHDDVQAILIILQNGYWRPSIDEYKLKYPNSKVTAFLDNNPCVHRRYISLDPELFKEMEKPELEKPGFFNKSRVKRENEVKMMNYSDRVNAQQKFIESIGKERWIKIKKEKQKGQEALDMVLNDMLENGW